MTGTPPGFWIVAVAIVLIAAWAFFGGGSDDPPDPFGAG